MNAIRDTLRTEIHATADELRRLKRWWRTPLDARPEPPTTRFALDPLKRRATLLCMLMAHSRGRIHLRSTGTVEDQGAQILAALDAMEPMKLQTPLLDARLHDTARAMLARRMQIARTSACVAPIEEHRA